MPFNLFHQREKEVKACQEFNFHFLMLSVLSNNFTVLCILASKVMFAFPVKNKGGKLNQNRGDKNNILISKKLIFSKIKNK